MSPDKKVPNLGKMAEAMVSNMYEGMALRSWKQKLRNAGYPIQKSGANPLDKIEFDNVQKMEDKYADYCVTSVQQMSTKDGKPDTAKIGELRMALATKPIQESILRGETKPLIRDFRRSELNVHQNNNTRIVFDDAIPEYQTVSYDPEALLLALAADSQGQESDDYTIIPYPHLNADKTIKAVTILIATKQQRETIKGALLGHR